MFFVLFKRLAGHKISPLTLICGLLIILVGGILFLKGLDVSLRYFHRNTPGYILEWRVGTDNYVKVVVSENCGDKVCSSAECYMSRCGSPNVVETNCTSDFNFVGNECSILTHSGHPVEMDQIDDKTAWIITTYKMNGLDTSYIMLYKKRTRIEWSTLFSRRTGYLCISPCPK